MLPKYLKIHGYRSYLDAEIDFSKFGNLFCVLGENGAGKSSIIEMITTALYYRNSCTDNKGTGMDEIIHKECDYFELKFCFEMNGNEYLIRSKKIRGGARELEFYINNVNQSEKILETQNKINDVIKLDYDVFLDTVCVGQGMSSRFMNKKPNERKETLAQILDIKKYELYEKEAREIRKETKNKIDELNTKIEFISSQTGNIDELNTLIIEKENENVDLENQYNLLTIEIEQITKEKIEYESLVSKNRLILNQRKQLSNQINNLQEKINNNQNKLNNIVIEDINYDDKINDLQQKIDNKRSSITLLKEEISKLNTENNFFEQEKRDIKTKHHNLEVYNKSICDFCGNEITPSHKEKHLLELKTSYKQINDKIVANNNKLEQHKKSGQQYSEEGKALSQEKKQLQEKQQLNEKNKQLKDKLKNEITVFNESLNNYQQQYNENISIQIEEVDNKVFNDTDLKRNLNDLNNKISYNKQQIAVMKSQINDVLKNNKILEDLNKQLNDLKIIYSDYDSISVAFGKKGIQKSIIKKDLNDIEIEINNVLKLLSDDSMSIKFITDKKGSKKDIDTLDIIVHDGIYVRNYDTYSGGERFRIDFACHIGLSKFLTKRAGASIDFFIIDEGLGSQDSLAKQKFIDTLYKISKIFKQVMCITHITELQDSFETKVLVEKDPILGSKIQIL